VPSQQASSFESRPKDIDCRRMQDRSQIGDPGRQYPNAPQTTLAVTDCPAMLGCQKSLVETSAVLREALKAAPASVLHRGFAAQT
jgi:hypothetical protein